MHTKIDLSPDIAPVPRIFLRAPDAARSLAVSQRTLKNWTSEGRIPFVQIGTAIFYHVAKLQEWAAGQVAAVKRDTGTYVFVCQQCSHEHPNRPQKKTCENCGKKPKFKRVRRMLDESQAVSDTDENEDLRPTAKHDSSIPAESLRDCPGDGS